MCEPTTIAIAVAATTVLAGAAGYVGDIQAAKAEEEHQKLLATDQERFKQATARAENKQAIESSFQLGLREQQEQAKQAQEAQQLRITSAQNIGTNIVSAASGGVTGVSMNNLVRDVSRQEGQSARNIDLNEGFRRQQLVQDLKGVRSNAISSVRNIRDYHPAPVRRPNLFATALGTTASAAGAGLGAYGAAGGTPIGG